MSQVLITWDCLSPRLRLGLFDVKIWLACDLENEYFPLPVLRNRLAAERLVLILGMIRFSCFCLFPRRWTGPQQPASGTRRAEHQK
jgi:hypothetical protein